MEKSANRWLIAGMGTLLQLCLGSVYAAGKKFLFQPDEQRTIAP
jgi:hypothetical protein